MLQLPIAEGQEVVSSDGQQVGKVVTLTTDTLVIEKGFLLPEALACSRSDVAEVRGQKVVLAITRAELEDRARAAGRAARTDAPSSELSAAGAQAMAEVTDDSLEGPPAAGEDEVDVEREGVRGGRDDGSASHP